MQKYIGIHIPFIEFTKKIFHLYLHLNINLATIMNIKQDDYLKWKGDVGAKPPS